MKQLRVLADLRECKEGFSGIAVDSCRVFRCFNQLSNVKKVGGLLISQNANSFKFKLFQSARDPDKYLRQANYLKSLGKPDSGDLRIRALNLLEQIKSKASLRWYLQHQFPIYPINQDEYADFIWQTFFAKTTPSKDYNIFLNSSFFGSQVCYPLAKLRTSRIFINPKIDTRDWDIFFTSTPMNLRVSRNTKKLVRYHDAIPIFHPHLTPNPPNEQYRQLKSCVNEVSSHFVCNSPTTQKELLTIFPQVEDRSTVIPCAVSDGFFKSDEQPNFEEIITNHLCLDSLGEGDQSQLRGAIAKQVLQNFSGRYLICVSSVEPRKNYNALIRAWASARAHNCSDLSLMIVGRTGWNSKEILQVMYPYVSDGSLIHLSGIPFASLRELLSHAQAYVFTTLAEGFGMGAIEAMRCGCPVIASSLEVLKWTCGEAALFVNPYDIGDIADAISRLTATDSIEAEILRKDLSAKGYKQSEQFTVANCQDKWETYLDSLF